MPVIRGRPRTSYRPRQPWSPAMNRPRHRNRGLPRFPWRSAAAPRTVPFTGKRRWTSAPSSITVPAIRALVWINAADTLPPAP